MVIDPHLSFPPGKNLTRGSDGTFDHFERGVSSLTRGLAHELAPRGITVNTIQPGPIDTDANPADGPLRHGRRDRCLRLVLAGPDAAYIIGSSLNIDGGFTA
jgi:3-oxoacyl-[acyl-carrier protein] reductase